MNAPATAWRASAAQRLRSLAAGILLLLCFPAASVIVRHWPDDSVSLCFFRSFTQHRCPLCGLTHAFAAAWELRWSAASAAHPLWWLFALLWVVIGFISLADALRGTQLLSQMRNRLPRWVSWSFAALLVAAWILRL